MIVTLEKQDLNKELRWSDFLFMEVDKVSVIKSEGLVKADILQFTLKDFESLEDIEKEGTKTDYTEEGVPVETPYKYKEKAVIIRPTFVLWKKREAIFKMDTYFEKIGEIKPEEYDRLLIEQIDFVNKLEEKPGRIQKDLYYFNLKAEEMKILTSEEKEILTAPRIKE